jgi:hypothetical protein
MDVVIDLKDGSILAIESKFTESFGGRKKTIREAYFDSDRWSRRGLPGAQSVANDVRRGRSFGTVDAPQLLKHTLGLASQNRTWSLLLLWYAPDSETAARMAGDAEDFKSALGPDGSRLRVMTYQELWPRIVSGCGAVDAAYVAYISSRYFVETQTEVFRIS